MEVMLIKVLHCLFFALHVILFNAFIHSFQSLALNRFNIKHHVGSRVGPPLMWPGFDSELGSYVAKFVVGSVSAPRGFPQGALVFPTLNTLASGSGEGATTPRVIELKQLI